MKAFIILALCVLGPAAAAQDIVIIGEVHDNPEHHRVQASEVAKINPSALVFEMLTADQAQNATADARASKEALEQALGWNDSGWPNFSMYYPIFAAAPTARIYGANVPPHRGRSGASETLVTLTEDAQRVFETAKPLPDDQQTAREALQMAAHCDALPVDILPDLVAFQRLRDAALALQAQIALSETGGPVVVITGNGHARKDWGVPALLAQKFPDISVKVIGQTEDGAAISGEFDDLRSSPGIDRPDPCLAFQ